MKKILCFVAILATVISVNAQSLSEKNVDVDKFSTINVSNGLDVEISESQEKGKITIIADEEYMPHVQTQIENQTLTIRLVEEGKKLRNQVVSGLFSSNKKANTRKKSPKIIVSSREEINKIIASGGSDVDTKNCTLRGNKLELVFSSGSDFNGNIDVDVCELIFSGGADCDISGKANHCDATFSGGSDLDAKNFAVKKYNCKTSGGSDAEIYCTDLLKIAASGASDINIKAIAKYKNLLAATRV